MIFSQRVLAPIVLGVFMAGSAMAQTLSIATGGTGGVYYPLGGGLANLLEVGVGVEHGMLARRAGGDEGSGSHHCKGCAFHQGELHEGAYSNA